MLWAAYRDHIGEIILTHIWNFLHVEVSQGPDIYIFQRFRSVYCSLSTNELGDLKFSEL